MMRKMAVFHDREKKHFPLRSIDDVVNLFRDQLTVTNQPNLSLLSIVLGTIENKLTINRNISQEENRTEKNIDNTFPVIDLTTIEVLYTKFVSHVRGSIDLSSVTDEYADRTLVKKIADIIWNSLARSYSKDRAHLQSLFSYLTGESKY